MKAVHLTSVHSPRDPRIFLKQCRALAAAGVDTVLVARADADHVADGVRIRALESPESRAERWTRTLMQVYRAAVEESADVYHLHDPELLPVGLALRARGARVVYDVHEDYVTAIRQKGYVPAVLRAPLALVAGGLERVLARGMDVVIAERYYQERFPRAVLVLNYPVITPAEPVFAPVRRLLYTGSVSADRGALHYGRLLRLLPEYEIHLVGRIPGWLLDQVRAAAGDAADRLVVPWVDRFVLPHEMDAYVRERRWLAGLAVFPRTPHYARKELTKFFEYMAYGIPVVATDFPTWRRLLEGAGAGVMVDPEDLEGVAAAIEGLRSDPAGAAAAGRRGQEAVRDRFSWEAQAANLLRLYGVAPSE